MSNDNGYYNNTGYPYGGGAPVPPPFPGDRRNRGREPYMDAAPGYGGEPYYNQPPRQQWQPAPAQQTMPQNNPMGVAGFVLSLITTVIGWVPYVGWLIWLLAVVFSAIGMGKKPRGLAVAGLIISVVLPVLLIVAVITLGISLAALGEAGL